MAVYKNRVRFAGDAEEYALQARANCSQPPCGVKSELAPRGKLFGLWSSRSMDRGMPGIKLNQRHLRPWNVTPSEAVSIQEQLRRHIVTENQLGSVTAVGGVDVGFPNRTTARAAIVVLRFPELTPIDLAVAEVSVEFPYIPGLLAFREVPAVLMAVEKLSVVPDLLIFDAHGLAHPRRLGLASHAGLLLDIASIGCAKSRLVGQYREPGAERGASSPLVEDGERIGAVVRTREKVKPVFISIGHRVDLDVARRYVLDCAPKYRLPETTRYAHQVAAGRDISLEVDLRKAENNQRRCDERPAIDV
jgi:deoxyribonuclease V